MMSQLTSINYVDYVVLCMLDSTLSIRFSSWISCNPNFYLDCWLNLHNIITWFNSLQTWCHFFLCPSRFDQEYDDMIILVSSTRHIELSLSAFPAMCQFSTFVFVLSVHMIVVAYLFVLVNHIMTMLKYCHTIVTWISSV